jgi:hypothetical protein
MGFGAIPATGDQVSKRLIHGLVTVALALAPVAGRAGCFTEAEWKAAHVRVLQTDLNVAQLECMDVQGASYNEQYKAFVARFGSRLTANAGLLKAHFHGAERELDQFITRIANDSSERSMHDMAFCANSAALFQKALALEVSSLESAALDYVTDHDEIGTMCPAAPIRVAAKKTTQAASTP